MVDDFQSKAHIIPEPHFAAAPIAPNSGREFERLFPGQPCFYCLGVPNSVDHVVPRSKGGKDEKNRVPCCTRCNQMKGNMMLEEFVEQMRKILQTLEAKKVIREGKVDMAAVIQAPGIIQATKVIQFGEVLSRPLAA